MNSSPCKSDPSGRPFRRRLPRFRSFAACTAAALAGCAVGPTFHEPALPPAASYQPGPLPAATSSAPAPDGGAQRFLSGEDTPGQWWMLFKSDDLVVLVRRALANNPTVESAQAALRQANEELAAQQGTLLPQFDANIASQRQRLSGASVGSSTSFNYTLNYATVGVAYTLDAFGGLRRQIEALHAQADYQRFALEAATLSLTANVVSTAINAASLNEQIHATEQIAEAQKTQLDLIDQRAAYGGASQADVLQQRATLANTLASLPGLRGQLLRQRNQLAAYLGDMPSAEDAGTLDLDSLTLPDALPVSLPSKLVDQRPDIREYSALLHRATAQLGVATANLLPQFTLSGAYGGSAIRVADLFSPASAVWSVIGSMTQPVFHGGQLVHQRRAAAAAVDKAAADYKDAVVVAFQQVADVLQSLQADADALSSAKEAERASQDSLTFVQAQFDNGAASYTQLLTAQQTYQNAVIALVKTRAQRLIDTTALFQALGGGWWNRTDSILS